jgi:hypothetical protein
MNAPLDKAPEIIEALDRLRDCLGSDAFVLADHWEIDLCAIGIASPANLGVLAYISCYGEQPGRFNYELELPPEPGSEQEYEVAGRGFDVPFEELAEIVRKHLGRPDG